MGLSFWRRTRDAILKPSLYFERIRQDPSMKDSFAYLLLNSVILYLAVFIPLLGFNLYSGAGMINLLWLILMVPLMIIAVFISSGLFHLATLITSGKRKRFVDSFKLMVFVTQTKTLVGIGLAYLFVALGLILFGSAFTAAYSPLGAMALLGLLWQFLVFYISALVVVQIYGSYFSFLTLVGLHKIHHISLERSFWTFALAVVFHVVLYGALYALFLFAIGFPAITPTPLPY